MVVSGVYQFLFVVMFFSLSLVEALDNGLALTPPMGWNSWLRYGCAKNCTANPNEYISENLIKRTADLMVRDGYLAAGYQYIVIDDCWQGENNTDLAADPNRFPSGMKALADYVHNKGLKLGLFTTSYNKVKTFASWNIDYLKIYANYSDFKNRNQDFDAFGKLPNPANHTILYACSWPNFEELSNIQADYSIAAEHCNSWRNYNNIANSWSSLSSIMSWFADNQDRLAPYAGPGHWNDPDMLSIGNSGLTENQAQVEMAVWSVLSAPLMMSVDLATIKPEYKKILLNPEIISVNQDQLGQQGLRIWRNETSKKLEVWNRKLSDGCYAVAFVNLGDVVANLTLTHEEMKLPQLKFVVMDLYNTKSLWSLEANESLTVQINATGVKFYKFTPNYKPLSINQRKKGLIFQHLFSSQETV